MGDFQSNIKAFFKVVREELRSLCCEVLKLRFLLTAQTRPESKQLPLMRTDYICILKFFTFILLSFKNSSHIHVFIFHENFILKKETHTQKKKFYSWSQRDKTEVTALALHMANLGLILDYDPPLVMA